MYNKLNLAVGKVASKTSIKPELGSIAFFGNRTVATDSFRLLEVSAPGAALPEPVLLNAKHLKGNLKITPDREIDIEEIMLRSGAEPIEATYPNFDKIVDEAFARTDDIKISINAKYLSEMLAILATMNSFNSVELSIPLLPGKAIVMTAKTSQKTDGPEPQVARGLVMPHNK